MKHSSINQLQYLSLILGIFGFGSVIISLRVLTEASMRADVRGEAAELSATWVSVFIGGILFSSLTIFLLTRMFKSQSTEAPSGHEGIGSLVLWTMIFTLAALIFYPFALIALVLSANLVASCYKPQNSKIRKMLIIIGVGTCVASILGILSTFTIT